MKIQCRQCGAKFNYEQNSGICPKCMTYHKADAGSYPYNKTSSHFAKWLSIFLLATALVSFPTVSRLMKSSYEEWSWYRKELKADGKGGQEQDIAPGEEIDVGNYYMTPEAAFWMPEVDMVGLIDDEYRFLIVPVRVQGNEDTPTYRVIDYKLEIGRDILDMDYTTYFADNYWPRLEGYFPIHYSFEEQKKDMEYLLFQVPRWWETDELQLQIQTSIENPQTYKKTTSRIYRIPLTIVSPEEVGEDPFLLNSHPIIDTKEPGTEFDYFTSRLLVSEVQCTKEAGDFKIPDGQKLLRVILKRVSPEWPHTDSKYTAVVNSDSSVSLNVDDYDLGKYFETDYGDIWGFYFEYNYVSTYSSENEKKEEEERENPGTVSQFYLIDENIEKAELILPGVAYTYTEEPYDRYWQIRVPMEIPEIGGTIKYE